MTTTPVRPSARVLITASLATAIALLTAPVAATAQMVRPVSIDAKKRFSIFIQATSDSGLLTKCTDLPLPPGPVRLEHIAVSSSYLMNAFLLVPTKHLTVEAFGSDARIAVPLSVFPGPGTNTGANVTTAVIIRDGGLAFAGPGELTRDEGHPVQICLQDDANITSYNSMWTISGAHGK